MKRLHFLVLSISLACFLSCENETFPEDIPDCMQVSITNALKSDFTGASLKLYRYNDQNVYIFDSEEVYPDKLTVAYNEKCEVVCEFGGIAGLNTCFDFSDKAQLVGTLWKDNR